MISGYELSNLGKISLFDLDNSKFMKLEYKEKNEDKEAWVYPKPLSFIEGGLYLGPINYPKQLALLKKASKRSGIELRHGTLKENVEAYWSKNTRKYRDDVLKDGVFTNDMIINEPEGTKIVRISDIKFFEAVEQAFIDETKKNVAKKENNYNILYIGREILKKENILPTRQGFFADFDFIPNDTNISYFNDGCKGYYWHTKDNEKQRFLVPSIGSGYLMPDLEYAAVGFTTPFYNINTIPIWTEQDPHK